MRTAVERIRHRLPTSSPSVSSSEHEGPSGDSLADDERIRDVLTNREQVIRVLDLNGGRVWQADIADRTGWSKAKVSRVLSEMESAGVITRFRNGRQKVVRLAEAEPRSSTGRPDAPAMK